MKHKMTLTQWKQNVLPPLDMIGDSIEIVAEKQIVNLSRVVGTMIPMEFGGCGLGFLESITDSADHKYIANDGTDYKVCRFDTSQDAWVSWGKHVSWYDGRCPIPDGVRYKILVRHAGIENATWTHQRLEINREIIAFRITGLKEGWSYQQ